MSLWTLWYRRRRHTFANDDGGVLVASRSRCHLRGWSSGGDDAGGGRIGVLLENENAPGRG